MAEPFKVVVPARYGSSRLPGKPLADLHGKPMIVRVAERCAASGAEEVVIATDDVRIVEAVTSAGFEATMTRADHASGSDRVMEVARLRAWDDDAIVINVQGDEPQMPPAVVMQVAQILQADPARPVATLCEPIREVAVLTDPNVVKVVRDRWGRALYFSRAPIPYERDEAPGNSGQDRGRPIGLRHIGVYGYRLSALQQFVELPVSDLERLEKLEQLRLLENGIPIFVTEACETVPAGVDTPADLERVRTRSPS
jgi:3-deoxy-manno-octulosonate cytidylyltransferase (CMP-KDO synthetase)